jgi:hypothetical protein
MEATSPRWRVEVMPPPVTTENLRLPPLSTTRTVVEGLAMVPVVTPKEKRMRDSRASNGGRGAARLGDD